jgi:hypothetical protein
MSDAVAAFQAATAPPDGADLALQALWWVGKGDWDRAHALAMQGEDADCAWVHAYLHRVEGDLSNAGYWYRRAGRPVATEPFDAEWAEIARVLLGRAG